MKKSRILPLGLVAALISASLFAGCSLFESKTSVDDCINSFMSYLNSSDRSNLYTTLDSSSSQYSQAKTATYWGIPFPASEAGSYALSGKSTNGNTVTAAITSSTLYATSRSIIFVMSTDSSGNAVIHSITVGGSPIFY